LWTGAACSTGSAGGARAHARHSRHLTWNLRFGGAEVQEHEAEAKAGPKRRERGCLGLVVRVSETGPVWRTMFLIRGTASTAANRSRQLSGAKRAPQQEMSVPNTASFSRAARHLRYIWKVDSLVSIKSTSRHSGAVLHAGKYITLPAEPTTQFHSFIIQPLWHPTLLHNLVSYRKVSGTLIRNLPCSSLPSGWRRM
jgi:hypothetical protein